MARPPSGGRVSLWSSTRSSRSQPAVTGSGTGTGSQARAEERHRRVGGPALLVEVDHLQAVGVVDRADDRIADADPNPLTQLRRRGLISADTLGSTYPRQASEISRAAVLAMS